MHAVTKSALRACAALAVAPPVMKQIIGHALLPKVRKAN